MNHPERQIFNLRKVVVLALVHFVLCIDLIVVVVAIDSVEKLVVLTRAKRLAASTYKTSTSFCPTPLIDFRMSVSRSKSPLLLFQGTNSAIRPSKPGLATSKWHTAVSHDRYTPSHTDSSFRMICNRIKLNTAPAVSTGAYHDTAIYRFRRQQAETRLWLSTLESNRSNKTSSDSVDNNNEKGTNTSSTKTTTKIVPTTDSDVEDEPSGKTATSMWHIPGLKKETYRRLDRAQKKVDHFTSRIERYKAQKNKPPVNSNPHLDLHILEAELVHAKEVLKEIRRFEMLMLTLLKSNGRLDMVLPEQVLERALALNMTDHPPTRPPRGEPKPKGPRKMEPTRKPYRKYTSIDNIEIRVGKKAEDNDELSTNPEYRDNDDWWMHASGCPGSHVIIRFSDKKQEPPTTTIQEAAMLAAKNSKCNGNIIKVNMCRARDIKKPPMSKPGLVVIQGIVWTVSVDMKASAKRLERLESTVEVN